MQLTSPILSDNQEVHSQRFSAQVVFRFEMKLCSVLPEIQLHRGAERRVPLGPYFMIHSILLKYIRV